MKSLENYISMKSLENYISIIRPDDNGTFVAYIPAIPSCHAVGETPEKAMQNLRDVFEMIQEEYLEEKRDMPSEVQIFIVRESPNTKIATF